MLASSSTAMPRTAATAPRRVGRLHRRSSLLGLALVAWALVCLPSFAEAAPRSASMQNKIGNNLYTSSVTYCSPPTGILVSSFSFEYFQQNESAVFELSAATVSDNLNPEAVISLDIYGITPSNWSINVCSYLDGLLCPLPRINFTGGSPLPVPSGIVDDIPSIAYTVPNLEAYVTVRFRDVVSGEEIACLQASLSNGWSTRQPGVLWGTSMFALAAVLLAWVHTAWNYCRLDPLTLTAGDRAAVGPTEAELIAGGLITGTSSPAQWRAVDVVYLFQSMAAVGLLTIDYPNVFAAFVLNFRWALGLFLTPSVQRTINSARAQTGGKMSSTAYPEIAFINKKTGYHSGIGGSASSSQSPLLAAYVLPTYNRLTDFLGSTLPASTAELESSAAALGRRAPIDSATTTSAAAEIENGIPVYAESLGIPTANAFMTVFFTWLMLLAVFLAVHALGFLLVWAADTIRTRRRAHVAYTGDRNSSDAWWVGRLRRNYKFVVIANALRVALMVFFPICIFSLYQFTLNDAWLPIFLAAITLFITVAGLLLAEASILLAARRARNHVAVSPTDYADRTVQPSMIGAETSSVASPDPVGRENSSVTLTNHTQRAVVNVRQVPRSLWSPFPNLRPHCSALYQQYRRPQHSFWLMPMLFAAFAKACFIAFAHGHGFVQVIALIIIEGLTFVAIVAVRPHTNKKGDWLSAGLALFRLVATGLMLAFFPRLGASGIVKTVMGLVCVAVWGFAVIMLLIGFFFNLFWGIIWKRHTPTSAIDDEAARDIQLAEEPRPVMLEKERDPAYATGAYPTDAYPAAATALGPDEPIPTFGDRYSTDGTAQQNAQHSYTYDQIAAPPASSATFAERPLSGGSFTTADSHNAAPVGGLAGLGSGQGDHLHSADGQAPLYTPATGRSAYWDAREAPGTTTATPQAGLNEKDPGGYFRSA